jgi:hypothetical protein
MNDYNYIINYYNVPAQTGRRITMSQRKGTIVCDYGHYLGVVFDDNCKTNISRVHPTHEMTYHHEIVPSPLKQLSPGQKRYQRFLEVGDSFDSFMHFLHWEAANKKAERLSLTI